MSRTHTLPKTMPLNPVIQSITSARTFDPIDFVKTNVTTEKARAGILSSMAWYIDMMVINQLRAVFFDLYRDMQAHGEDVTRRTADSYSDFLKAMNDRVQREANMVELGFMESAGVGSIRKLLVLRQDWHNEAMTAMTAVRTNFIYVVPTIEELLRNEKPQMPNALTKEKLRALAEDVAEGDTDAAVELFNDLVLREELQAKDRHAAAAERHDALIGIGEFIEHTNPVSEADFNDLPLDSRKRLITGIKNSIAQATQRLATDRTVNVLDFMAARKELKATTNAINAVLAHPMFDEDESPITKLAHDRQEKSLAARGFEADASGKYTKVEAEAAQS
jgi:hypothetical protein